MSLMAEYFEGFPREYIDFLWELRMNNNTEWFRENKDRYEGLIKRPMKLFSDEMTERLNSMGMGEGFTPAISRANRDIRFSKDKSPYKDRKWVVFNFGKSRWQEKCCFYFEISPEGRSSGLGIYDAGSAYMARYRSKLTADPEGAKALKRVLAEQSLFAADTERYKKSFVPEGADGDIADWYQLKNVAFTSEYRIDDILFERELLDEIEREFAFLKPFFEYFKGI